MRVLITGVAGHLGSKFAQWLLDNVMEPDIEIFGIDDLSCGYRENVPLGVNFNSIPLGMTGTLQGLCDMDYVFHFAAYAAEGLSPFIRRYNYLNNLLATAQIVNFCIATGVKRLVFTSSMAVYGSQEVPFGEGGICKPIDPYGNAKLACERDIQIAGEQHGLDWCILRPHNIYGPGQDIWTPYRNVLGIWMAKALAGKPMLVYGDGLQSRAFSFIDDVLSCLWQAALAKSASKQIINLGGNKPTQILEVARLISKITGAEIEHAEKRHEVRHAWCTIGRSVRCLGYRTDTQLSDGVRSMWQWAKEAWTKFPERRDSHKIDLEIEKGVYSYWRKEP